MNTIFFSWQSDLPNSDNRNFIEDVIKKSIKELNQNDFSLALSIDKDTNQLAGSPDIANSILTKISKSSAFIADISIINDNSSDRKMPNPNVLFELGYAVKQLGWENVICLFNTDSGSLEELPFDLRNRRVLTYSIKNKVKSDEKKKLIQIFKGIIRDNERRMELSREIIDYYNVDIYNQMILLLKNISKLLRPEENHGGISFKQINLTLSIVESEVKDAIADNSHLGFTLFKDYSEIENNFNSLLNKIIQVKYFNDTHYLPLINLIKTLRKWNRIQNRYIYLNDFLRSSVISDIYKVVGSQTERKLLLKRLDDNNHDIGKVIDFGDFKSAYSEDDLISTFRFNNQRYLEIYSEFILEIVNNINTWIELNDGEFLIDNVSMEFSIKNKEN